MRLIAALAATLLATLLTPPPLAAQQADHPARVETVFRPPLDTVLNFRIARTRYKQDGSSISASWIEQLRFVRSGAGFVVHWRMDAASLPPEMRDPLAAAMIAPFTGDPIAFDLDEEGELVRVRDWAAVRPRLLAVVEAMRSRIGSDPALADKVIAQTRAMFEGLSAEQAPGVLMKSIAPVLGWGGVSMAVGETQENTAAQAIPPLGATIARTARVTMVAAVPGQTATIEITSAIDQAAIETVLRQFADRLGAADDPARRAEMNRQLAASPLLSVNDATRLVLDLATALPRTLDNRRTASPGGEKPVETVHIEWLR